MEGMGDKGNCGLDVMREKRIKVGLFVCLFVNVLGLIGYGHVRMEDSFIIN